MAFALAVGARRFGPIVLLRSPARGLGRVALYGEGLSGLGIDPGRLLIVETRGGLELLRAALDAARCAGLAAVVLESWGELRDYDLTASRRLVLAAEASRVPVILLRGDAAPHASAAHTRWRIRAAPSVLLEAHAPGAPAIEAELLRRRGGPAGMRWHLEWDDEDGIFRERSAPLSGAVVSFATLRSRAA